MIDDPEDLNLSRVRNRDRLSIHARPYSSVGLVGAASGRKRYLHVPAHGTFSASHFLELIHKESGLKPPDVALTNLWSAIDETGRAAFSIGALQVKDDICLGRLEAKAYFKPVRMEGAGIRQSAMVLARAVDSVEPGSGERIREEVLRRDVIERVFYVAVSLRPHLEVETYHDVEFRRSDYQSGEILGLTAGLVDDVRLQRRAMDCVTLAESSGLKCNHISCDLWPLGVPGLTVVFAPKAYTSRTALNNLTFVQAISSLAGCQTMRPDDVSQMTFDAKMQPSLIAVKIGLGKDGLEHSVLIEEVDAEFAHLL
jgi:hypothetical protein